MDELPVDIIVILFLLLIFVICLFCWLCQGTEHRHKPRPHMRRRDHFDRTSESYKDEDEEEECSDFPSGSTCSLEEAAIMAFTADIALLRINTGHIYWSEHHQQHAEGVFINTTSISASDVHSIWIKNSPSADCSRDLIDHFSMTDIKPTIYIGKIWDGDDSDNRQGLRNLIIEGFVLKIWDTPRNKNIEHTQDYLDKLSSDIS